MKFTATLLTFAALAASPAPAVPSTPPAAPPAAEDSAELERATQQFMELTDAVNAIGLSGKTSEEKVAALQALHPRAEKLGELVRRVGSKRVREATNSRMSLAEVLLRYAGLIQLEQESEDNEALDDAMRELLRVAEGRPAPPPPTPEAEIVAGLMDVLRDTVKLRGAEPSEEQFAELIERLDVCYDWMLTRDAPVAEAKALLAQEEELLPLLEQLDFLAEYDERGNAAYDAGRNFSGNLEEVLFELLPPEGQTVLRVQAMRPFLEHLNTFAAGEGELDAAERELLVLNVHSFNNGLHARRDVGSEELMRAELERRLHSAEGQRLYPALQGSGTQPARAATVRTLLARACGQLHVADTPEQVEQAMQVARRMLALWEEVDAIRQARKLPAAGKRRALEAIKPRAAELGQALPPAQQPRIQRALILLMNDDPGLAMLNRVMNSDEEDGTRQLVIELNRLAQDLPPRLAEDSDENTIAAFCADALTGSREQLDQPGISMQDQLDGISSTLTRLHYCLPLDERRPLRGERSAELRELLDVHRSHLRAIMRQGGGQAIDAASLLFPLNNLARELGLEERE